MWYVITKLVANCKDVYLIKMVNSRAVVLFIRISTCFEISFPVRKYIDKKTWRKNMFHEKAVCHRKFPESKKFVRIYKKSRIYLLEFNLSLGCCFSLQQMLSFISADIYMYHCIMFQTPFGKNCLNLILRLDRPFL